MVSRPSRFERGGRPPVGAYCCTPYGDRSSYLLRVCRPALPRVINLTLLAVEESALLTSPPGLATLGLSLSPCMAEERTPFQASRLSGMKTRPRQTVWR